MKKVNYTYSAVPPIIFKIKLKKDEDVGDLVFLNRLAIESLKGKRL